MTTGEQSREPEHANWRSRNGTRTGACSAAAIVIVDTHIVLKMTTVNRKYVLLACGIATAATFVLCLTVFRKPLTIAYHQWRMSAEFNTVFGDPQPAGNGLASFDVTGVNVDAVMKRYSNHRQKLVDLGVLRHFSSTFSRLNSDGTQEQSQARSAFVNRIWSQFPGHRHYYLSADGSFETWIPVADETAWIAFIDDETMINQKTR